MSSSNGASASGSSVAGQQERWKVAIIGSGNWGSAIAKIVGQNAEQQPELFDREVTMWMYEEQFEGRPLTEQFNEKHENVKYLPGVKIAEGVVAEPSLLKACAGANALIFVTPHQFIPSICKQLHGKLPKGTRAISLVKGVDVHEDKIHIFSEVIEEHLGVSCAALSGANIANEVARDAFSETTIGCRNKEDGERWVNLFHTNHFRVSLTDDVLGVSLAGALKNVVAVAAGLVDGMQMGNNAKAAIMRIGLMEMKKFSKEFFEGIRDATFVEESCGIADLITSSLGGRNRQCAEAFVTSGKSFDQLEEEMLKGQKLQGVQTARELHAFLKARGKVDEYPLFTVVYRIAYENIKPQHLTAHI